MAAHRKRLGLRPLRERDAMNRTLPLRRYEVEVTGTFRQLVTVDARSHEEARALIADLQAPVKDWGEVEVAPHPPGAWHVREKR